MLCAPSQQQKKNQFNWAANPIIKRNIVILNEMWNQQLLMLIDPCSKWSRALKHLCAIYHFSLVSAYSSILFSASDDENKSSKPLPRSQMGRERKVDKLYLELPQMIAACQPWLLFCVGVGLSVAYEWLKNRLFSSRLVSLITISHLSHNDLARTVQRKARFSFVWEVRRSTETRFSCCVLSIVRLWSLLWRKIILMLRGKRLSSDFFLIKNSAGSWTWLQIYKFSRCTLTVWNNWKQFY